MRVLAILFLVVGAVLLLVSINATHHVSEKVMVEVTGEMSDETFWQMILGCVSLIVGAALLVVAYRRHR